MRSTIHGALECVSSFTDSQYFPFLSSLYQFNDPYSITIYIHIPYCYTISTLQAPQTTFCSSFQKLDMYLWKKEILSGNLLSIYIYIVPSQNVYHQHIQFFTRKHREPYLNGFLSELSPRPHICLEVFYSYMAYHPLL